MVKSLLSRKFWFETLTLTYSSSFTSHFLTRLGVLSYFIASSSPFERLRVLERRDGVSRHGFSVRVRVSLRIFLSLLHDLVGNYVFSDPFSSISSNFLSQLHDLVGNYFLFYWLEKLLIKPIFEPSVTLTVVDPVRCCE